MMATYQIEELNGEVVVTAETVVDDDPMKAAERFAGRPISRRALQEHWFRVVDEERGVLHEFSLAEPGDPKDFSK